MLIRRVWKRAGIVAFLWTLVFLTQSPLAFAGNNTTESNASLYVSEQFKAVAKRLVRQYIGEKIRSACPDGRPLCAEIVARLPDAFEAAVDGNKERLQAILSSFFVESSITGAMSLAIGDLATAKLGSLDKTARKQLADVLSPLTRCLLQFARDHRTGCDLQKSFIETLKTLNQRINLIKPGSLDDAAFKRLLADPTKPKPADVVRILEAFASSEYVDRADIRQYLYAIERAIASGTENGIFGFVQNLLGVDISAIELLKNTSPDPAQFEILVSTTTMEGGVSVKFEDAFKDCGEGPVWTTWAAQRSEVDTDLRTAAWLQQTISPALRLLNPLIQVECRSSIKVTSRKVVEGVRRKARYLEGALRMFELRNRGAILLGIAAVLDLVRTSDKDQFASDAKTVLAGATDRFSLRLCVERFDRNHCITAAKAGEMMCQPAFVSAIMRGRDPLTVPPCWDIESKQLCKKFEASVLPPGTTQGASNKCHFPELALLQSSTPEDASRAFLETILKYVKQYQQPLRDKADDDGKFVDTLIRVLEHLRGGNPTVARKAMIRLAVEELLDHVKRVIQQQLGVESRSCEDDTHGVSVFSGIGARCAALVLIEAAYYPIAELIWDGGIDAAKAAQVSDSAYQSVLQSKFLAGSPILLNVGLGANVIWGNESVWGNDSYKALTVLDKFGLVIYRRRWEKETVQTGIFVGGFLDALVRTIDGTDRKFWLAGVSAGLPRIRGYDFGIELHAAAVLPFAFDSRKQIGFSLGGALVIPWDYWKEK